MNLTRRNILRGVAVVPLIGALPALADEKRAFIEEFTSLVNRHPLLATHRIANAYWKPFALNYQIDMTPEAIAEAKAMGIDVRGEVRNAVRQENIACAEQYWVTGLRNGAPLVATYDQGNLTEPATFVCEEFKVFATMLLERSQGANTIIVSPTALTILQSSNVSHFARVGEGLLKPPEETMHGYSSLRYVGLFDERCKVYCDIHAKDGDAVLIGYVPVPEERRAAVVQTDAVAFELGLAPRWTEGWRSIGVAASSLTFL